MVSQGDGWGWKLGLFWPQDKDWSSGSNLGRLGLLGGTVLFLNLEWMVGVLCGSMSLYNGQ